MGLSASQARLLNLTARMHDIEYKAQNLEAQKLQMANESRHVYQEYEDALNRQKVQFKKLDPSGAFTYEDASVNTLLKEGYRIKILSGNNWYDLDHGGTIGTTQAAGNWHQYSTVAEEVEITALSADKKAGFVFTDNGQTYKLAQPASAGSTKVMVYKQLNSDPNETARLATIDLSNNEVLRNLVEAGFIVFEKPMPDGTLSEVNIATDTNLQEITDEVDLKKAEAKYEADMRRINNKDKKFDTDLAALDNERTAIKAEMETLKSVAKENVDRTFKLFS